MPPQPFAEPRGPRQNEARPGRNRELDWLRAYAIVIVVLEHAVMVKPVPTFWSAIHHHWWEGHTGVDLFFVISGFVISQSFVGGFDRERAAGRPALAVAVFYARRLVRLWPPAAFWAAIIVAGSLATRRTPSFPVPALCLDKFVAALTYTSNWSELVRPTPIGYFYSLATEMQFYLAFPFVLWFVPPRWRLAAATGVLSAAVLLGTESHPQTRFAGIVVGVMLFLLSRTGIAARMASLRLAGRVPACAFTLLGLGLLVTCNLPPMSFATASLVASAVAALLVGAGILQRGWVCAFGVPRVLDWIGSRSYSLYLCHIPVMLLNRAVDFDFEVRSGVRVAAQVIPDAALIAQWLVSLVAASELTYLLLERPCQAAARDLGEAVAQAAVRLRAPRLLPLPVYGLPDDSLPGESATRPKAA